jgi:hypothetical protein
MLIDLHTHTQPLSHDSLLTPDDLIEAAKAAGLDAVCLTEHDFTWDADAARELARRHGFTIIPAIEVNTEDGHFLAFGIDRYVYGMHRVDELARLVEEAGGALIAAHPYRRQLPFHLRHDGDWSGALERALSWLRPRERLCRRALRPPWPARRRRQRRPPARRRRPLRHPLRARRQRRYGPHPGAPCRPLPAGRPPMTARLSF